MRIRSMHMGRIGFCLAWLLVVATEVQADKGYTLRLPIRGTPGTPEIHLAGSEVIIEVPEGKLDRAQIKADSGPVQEALATTSRSKKRAQVILRLRPGAEITKEAISARIGEGALLVGVTPAVVQVPPKPKGEPAPVAPPKTLNSQSSEQGQNLTRATRNPFPKELGLTDQNKDREILWIKGGLVAFLLVLLGLLVLQRRRTQKLVADGRLSAPATIEILATRVLGKNQRLLLVEVQGKRFLLAASETGVRLLSRVGQGHPAQGQLLTEEAQEIDPSSLGMGLGIGEGRHKDPEPKEADNLEGVFAEMLSSVPAPPETPPKQKRPVLQIVKPEEAQAKPERTEAPPPPPKEADAEPLPQTKVAPSPLGRNRDRTELSDFNDGSHSTDVAGLLALRKNRLGGMR